MSTFLLVQWLTVQIRLARNSAMRTQITDGAIRSSIAQVQRDLDGNYIFVLKFGRSSLCWFHLTFMGYEQELLSCRVILI